MNARTIQKLATSLIACSLAVGAAACGSSEQSASGEVTVTDAWIREPADGQTIAAGYATITNDTDDTITLIGASAPIAATFEIHETSVSDDGTMSMAEKEGGFDIRAGDSFNLEPGGPHVMMLGIEPTEITGSIDLTFVFDASEVTVPAAVRAIGDGMAETDMGGSGDADS